MIPLITDVPIWIAALSSVGFPAIVVALFNALSKRSEIKHGRIASREAKEIDADAAERQRDFESLNLTRSQMEKHIRWDYMIIARTEQCQSLINELQRAAGITPTEFAPIPAPPEVFSVRDRSN